MYPEEGGAGAPPLGGGSGFTIGRNLEGLIPIILIIVIAFFLAMRFGFITGATPVLGSVVDLFGGADQPLDMLVIGSSSQEVIDILNANPHLVKYRVRTPESLERNPREQLRQYDVVMLDQSEEASKEVSRELGEELESFVKTGGKLIIVKDSGIRRKGAYDVIGWKATFGDIVPVDCDRVVNNIPVCLNRVIVRGTIQRQDEDHPIMEGIELVPADPAFGPMTFETFDVGPTGNEIAVMQDARTGVYLPAIVEKKLIVGKSIYFNYNPGKTVGIFENTLEYLK